ncbi:MAG: BLUF domain-containing protein [Steroidobacteraceae bacterium]|nr:BLUF domain-containing protein [Steroidobacteraceae bacterium]
MLAIVCNKRARTVDLIHCIYSSRASTPMREDEVQSMLEGARRKNVARDITGMLLLIEGSFFQVLEGDAAVVDKTYEAIASDARHDRVTQIIREPIAQRSFGEWSMGFAEMGRAEAQRLVGENDFFDGASCLEHINPGRARKLLVAFGAGRWRTDRTGSHPARARVGELR